MYSYEDRMRAVQLYIKLDKRISATLRQLGYPTKNSLKAWYREYERHHGSHTCYERLKPRYSAAQRQVAVEHYLSHGRCLAATRRALGYPGRATLSDWIGAQDAGARRRVVGRVAIAPRSPAQKQAAVIDLCTRQGSARGVAEQLGVSRQALYTWKNQQLGREAPRSMTRPDDLSSTARQEELAHEVETLRRDILRLQLEHDLLDEANELLKKGLGHRPAAPEQSREDTAG